MAIKLIKACKELNIGMTTLTEWCTRNGHPIEYDPNFRLSDELFALLAEEFHRDKEIKINVDRALAEAKALEASVSEPSSMPVHQNNDNQRERKQISNNDHHLNSKLKDVPYSYGQVSLFRDRFYAFQVYGLVKGKVDEECFYHVHNCLAGESIENGDFVLYKPAPDPKKGRLTAYDVRHPREEDGFEFIFDFYWSNNESYTPPFVSPSMVDALLPYSKKHWSLEDGYEQILLDAKKYLLECDADSFGKYCKTLICVKTLKEQEELSADFLISLSELILPFIDQERLVSIFKSFYTSKEVLLSVIHKFEDSKIAQKAVESFFTDYYFRDAGFIMEMESHNVDNVTCRLFRNCYAVKYADLSDLLKARLYLNGFDDTLRDSLSDEDIVQELKTYNTFRICEFYSHHKHESQIVISACCEILKRNVGYDGSECKSCVETWSECLSDLLPGIKRQLADSINDDYLRLWKYGVVDIAPSTSDFIKLLNKADDAVDSIRFWIKCGYIDSKKAGLIFNQWYQENIALTNESPEERFNYIHKIYRQFGDCDIEFDVPKVESEYFPIIDWFEKQVCGNGEQKGVDFQMLSKYYYLFSDYEQVQIVRYIFGLMAAGVVEKSLEPLFILTSKGQKQITNNSNVHVCFDVDLVLEAMIKFKSKKEFSAERELLSLLLTNHADVDFFERNAPIIHYLFDRCAGFLWRKHVEQYDDYGKLLGKKWIERTYERPSKVVFCEGRELEKEYEGEKRYKCRSVLCARTNVKLHESWKEYTMYDFCHILDFDLSDVDYVGFRCENGKYLKFMTLLNRFMQFAEHLYCRECHRLMMPSGGLTNLAVAVSTRFECVTNGCSERGRKIYLTHCFNPKCGEPVDERDSAKCPSGWYICRQCATCCSDHKNSQLLEFYKTYRPSAVPSSLVYAVQNHTGHLEKDVFYCPKCGSVLEVVIGRSDMDHVCSNPNCHATFTLDQWHRKPHNRV